MTLAATAGMARLFRGPGFAGPLVAAAATAHVSCWAGRRLGVRASVTSLVALALTALVGVWTTIPSTTLWGVPTLDTAHRIASELSKSRTDFALLRAPVPATEGFRLIALAAVGAIATVGDWAAFRLGLGIEAVLPSFALVVFTDALGTAAGRVLATAVYAFAVVVFALAQEARRRSATTRWVGGAAEAGRAGLFGRGLLMGVAAVVIGAAAGPALPGANASALVQWTHREGAGHLTTVSPLVDLRSTEVYQARTELFAVTARRPSYWRLTALDHFDGNVWSADQRFRPAGNEIGTGPQGTPLEQKITIAGLSEPWLPAAYQAKSDDLPESAVDPASSSLLAGSDTRAGMTYDVTSVVPSLSTSDLEQVHLADLKRDLGGDYQRMVQLPDDLPGSIRKLASQIVAGETAPYDQALALQDFLRSSPFTYSLNVPAGHDNDALVNFLFNTRRGFCEQFAGAYAVMARAVGLPTRVAVGFTPGVLRRGTFHVYGVHAHAWPEVYLGGRFGWVAFEPTPGRGEPGATWTLLDAAQARLPGPSATLPAAALGPAPPRPGPAASPALASGLRGLLATGGGPSAPPAPGGPDVPLLVATVALATTLVGLGLVPLLRRLQTGRRRGRARDPSGRVLVAWSEASERLGATGLARSVGETPAEYARRAGEARLGPVGGRRMAALAELTAEAAYSGRLISDEAAVAAAEAAEGVSAEVSAGLPAWRRLLAAVDPRPLLPEREKVGPEPPFTGSTPPGQSASERPVLSRRA